MRWSEAEETQVKVMSGKTPGTGAGLTKEMQSKCGGKADWRGAEENRTETKQCKRHRKDLEKAQNRN